jgi:DNA-binding NarL/FixJ family response regulator
VLSAADHRVAVDIVEDQRLIRDLLAEGLAASSQFRVRHCFESGEDALDHWATRPPQAVILDVSLPGINGVNTGVRLKRNHPGVPIVILTSYSYPGLLDRLPQDVRAGWGYLRKGDVTLATVQSALTDIIAGRVVEPDRPKAEGDEPVDLAHLTTRQREVLRLIAAGYSNEHISVELHLTRKSVENYVNRIFAALGLGDHDVEVNRRVVASLIANSVLDIEVDR